jgi:hypothetical protein
VAVLAFAEPDPNLHEVIPGERSGNAVSQLSSACASIPRGSAHALTATVADASRRAAFHAAAARLCAAVRWRSLQAWSGATRSWHRAQRSVLRACGCCSDAGGARSAGLPLRSGHHGGGYGARDTSRGRRRVFPLS